jgi:hypothetical protein
MFYALLNYEGRKMKGAEQRHREIKIMHTFTVG